MVFNEVFAVAVIFATNDQLGVYSFFLAIWVYLSLIWIDDIADAKSS